MYAHADFSSGTAKWRTGHTWMTNQAECCTIIITIKSNIWENRDKDWMRMCLFLIFFFWETRKEMDDKGHNLCHCLFHIYVYLMSEPCKNRKGWMAQVRRPSIQVTVPDTGPHRFSSKIYGYIIYSIPLNHTCWTSYITMRIKKAFCPHARYTYIQYIIFFLHEKSFYGAYLISLALWYKASKKETERHDGNMLIVVRVSSNCSLTLLFFFFYLFSSLNKKGVQGKYKVERLACSLSECCLVVFWAEPTWEEKEVREWTTFL